MNARRFLSFVLLVAAGLSFGGLGQFLHEMQFDAGDAATVAGASGSRESQNHDRGHHPTHDHEQCVVCRLLAAPRMSDRPVVLGYAPWITPPLHTIALEVSVPRCVEVLTGIDARGPPVLHSV